MSEQQSIRDDIAAATHAWRDHAIDGTPLGERPICNCYDYADHILASPVIRRIQAEVLREAADALSVGTSNLNPANPVELAYINCTRIDANELRHRADRIEKGER